MNPAILVLALSLLSSPLAYGLTTTAGKPPVVPPTVAKPNGNTCDDHKKPEVEKPEPKKPESKKPEAKKPEAKKPEAKKPEPKKLEAKHRS